MKNLIKNPAPPQIQSLISTPDLSLLPDKDLYKLCKDYGKQSRKWAREFGFLLPEVLRRGLYRKYGCASIQMFAAKLAGMSREVVDRILSLHKKLIAKPFIWAELRRLGWSKLRVIAEVSEFETENFWLDKLRKCTKAVLEEYVRKYRKNQALDTQDTVSVPYKTAPQELFSFNRPENLGTLNLGDDKTKVKNLDFTAPRNENSDFNEPQAQNTTFKKLKFNVDTETEFLFKEFKQNLEKQQKQALTMGETLKELLKTMKNLQKSKNLQAATEKTTIQAKSPNEHPAVTRHVKKAQKTVIRQTYGTKCSFPGCNNPSLELHHPDRFSLNPSHKNLTPLCRLHHQAAHTGLIENEDQPVQNWQFQFTGKTQTTNIFQLYRQMEKEKIDQKVRSRWT